MPLDAHEKSVGWKFDGIDHTTILRLTPDRQSFVQQRAEELMTQVIPMGHTDRYFRSTMQLGETGPRIDPNLLEAEAV
jgi:hypothetical protein